MSKWVRGYDGERHNLDLAYHLKTVPRELLESVPDDWPEEEDYAAIAIYYPGGITKLEVILFAGSEKQCDHYRRDLVGIVSRHGIINNKGYIGVVYADPADQEEAGNEGRN